MTRHTSQRGFVLLMVLVLLTIAAAVLAGVARSSSTRALDARDAESALQRRWATRTLSASVAGRIETILAEQEGFNQDASGDEEAADRANVNRLPPVAEWRVECQLAGRRYTIVLTDEQAKLNVNRQIAETSLETVAAQVQRLTRGARPVGEKSPACDLRPNPIDTTGQSDGGRLPRFGSFDQVFASASPIGLMGQELRRGYAAKITCWGDGRLNIRRASPEALEAACGDHVGPSVLQKLIAARDADAYRPLDSILDAAGIHEEATAKYFHATLTDESNCHGLWIVADDVERKWVSFYVVFSSRSPEGGPRARSVSEIVEFAW